MVKLLGKEVGNTGYGLMGLTWKKEPPSQEQCFKAMKAALESGNINWNAGELYGTPEYNSMHLLNAYFTKYPEDADKVVLSVKGAVDPTKHVPDGSEAGVKRSIDTCLKLLDGKKSLDLFEPARVDPTVPIENTVKYIDNYVKAGKIGGISLSECSANTIRRAAKVAKISAVEVEFSMFSTDILTNGIAEACAEHNIPIIAYSPIGRGFLTGQIRKPEDIPKDDMRSRFPRFQGENFYENMKLVHDVEKIAERKGATPGQIALAWVRGKSGKNGLPEILPIPGASTEERVKENAKEVHLSEEEMKEIDDILANFTTKGDRYGGPGKALMNG